ncbi:helix-turn-helix transcriptional regulator [Streptomyces sp. NPDC001553]|uniref:helix-turn-helix domain-containing protein n=1 Tax=Streptomyces sp. NPDC001553 TaxID=3154385 RepID=UPI00332045EE
MHIREGQSTSSKWRIEEVQEGLSIDSRKALGNEANHHRAVRLRGRDGHLWNPQCGMCSLLPQHCCDAGLLDFEAGHPRAPPSIAILTRKYQIAMNPLPGDLFARRLRQERERLGISQAELARRMAALLGANVDSTAITRIEQQTRAVRLDEAVTAAEALGVPLITLVSDNYARENEAEIQKKLAELALAEQEWERLRQTIHRLTQTVQQLSAERDAFCSHALDVNPETAGDYELAPETRAALDARMRDARTKPAGQLAGPEA